MLLTNAELAAIQSGDVTLVFRRWKRPTVKSGSSLRTAIGVLAIESVAKMERSQIAVGDAAKAGYRSLSDLLGNLDSREGEIYRIEIRFAGADPRIELRENDRIGESDLHEIRARLARLDASSKLGAWTVSVLEAIDEHPRVAAAELSVYTGFEKAWLKENVRKLKNLGLTISHQSGYELSPRGRTVLRHLEGDA